MWLSIDDSTLPVVEERTILGKRVGFMGRLPQGREGVLLSSDGFVTGTCAKAMFMSALEVASSGKSVVTVATGRGMSSVIKGTEAAGGTLHIIAVEDFQGYYRKSPGFVHAALASGGSVIAVPDKGLCWNLALSFSSLFLATVSGRSFVLEEAVDMGIGTVLLRASLEWKGARRYAGEGCPVADSYSSLFSYPATIAYEEEKGTYGFMGSFFSIMRLSERSF